MILIDDKLDKIIRQTRKKIKSCLKNTTPKTNITSDNANKITVSQDFGGNTYSKNSMILYNTNDKF